MKNLGPAGKKLLRNVCGGALIALGIVGLVLPVLQGIAFIVAGFVMLDFEGKARFTSRIRNHPIGQWLEEKWKLFGRGAPGSGQ
ncbi:MAG: hypothetical protein ACE5FC_07835 [Myxococcota bacterium]